MIKIKKLHKILFILAVFLAAVGIFGDKAVFSLVTTVYSLEKNMMYEKIMSAAYSYEKREYIEITIMYTETDEKYVNMIADNISLYKDMLYNDFELTDKEISEDIVCIIYPNKHEMSNATGIKYDNPPMGLYFGGVIHILSPEQWIQSESETEIKSRFLKEGPIVHELTHVAVDMATSGNYPIWFTEGVALYFENKYTGFEWRTDLSDKCKTISYKELNDNFRKLDEPEAYRRAYEIISAYVDENGEYALCTIMKKLKVGYKLNDIYNFYALDPS